MHSVAGLRGTFVFSHDGFDAFVFAECDGSEGFLGEFGFVFNWYVNVVFCDF